MEGTELEMLTWGPSHRGTSLRKRQHSNWREEQTKKTRQTCAAKGKEKRTKSRPKEASLLRMSICPLGAFRWHHDVIMRQEVGMGRTCSHCRFSHFPTHLGSQYLPVRKKKKARGQHRGISALRPSCYI